MDFPRKYYKFILKRHKSGIFGIVLSLLIRATYIMGTGIVPSTPPTPYLYLLSIHGITLFIFYLIPVLICIYLYTFPIMSGASSSKSTEKGKWGSIADISILLLPFLPCVDPGWTIYPPLSNLPYTLPFTLDILLYLTMSTSLNLAVTIQCKWRSGWVYPLPDSSHLLPTYCTLFLYLLSVPSLLLFLLYSWCARTYLCSASSTTLLFTYHLFWFFGHPEVYSSVILPFSVIDYCSYSVSYTLLPTLCISGSYLIFTFLSTSVWGHHLFTTSYSSSHYMYFTTLTWGVSLPSLFKVLLWCYTSTYIRNGYTTTSTLLIPIVFGGLSGITLAHSSVSTLLHDTHFVTSHFHYFTVQLTVPILFLLYNTSSYPGLLPSTTLLMFMLIISSCLYLNTIYGSLTYSRRMSSCSSAIHYLLRYVTICYSTFLLYNTSSYLF